MRKFLLAAILVALGVALLWVTFNSRVDYSSDGPFAVAEHTWGDVCGPLEPKIEYDKLPTPGQAGEARTQWIDLPGGGRQYTECTIRLDRRRIHGQQQFCAVVVHEYGHLAGHGHSNDPNSVMYPKATKRNIPAACK